MEDKRNMTTYHGTEVKVAAKTDNTVAYTDADQVIDFNLRQGGNVFTRHELGERLPQELKAGKIETELTFTRAWESGDFSAAGDDLQGLLENGTEIYVALFPSGGASPKILLNACKVTNWGINVNIDGLLNETCTVVAKSITIS